VISGKFFKSSVIYTIGGAMPMASGLVLLPFYTDLLSIGTYGILMLYIVFGLIMQVLTTYALDAYIGVHYIDVKDKPEEARNMIGAVTGLLLVLGVVIIPLSGLIGRPVFDVTYNTAGNLDFYPWGFMSVAVGFFNGFFKAATNLMVFRQEPGRFLWFNVANFILTIGISLTGLYMYPGELNGPMYGRLLSGVGIFLMALWFLWSNYGINFKFRYIKGLHKFCAPYLVYLILVWLVANVDRIIINDAMSEAKVGLYDFAVRCTLLIDLLQNGLIAAVNPVVFTIWKNNNDNSATTESNRYFNVFTAASIVFAAGFSFLIPLCIPLVVKNTAYYESFAFMGALASGFALRGLYHYFLSPILYLKKTRLLPIAFALSAALQIPLTMWLARHYQIDGVIWASIIVKAIQALFLFLVIRPYFKFRFNVFKLFILPVAFVVSTIAMWQWTGSYNWMMYGLLLVVTGAGIAAIYHREVRQTLNKFAQRNRS
jgi:O-antigen/teichoic acid export membrane protein